MRSRLAQFLSAALQRDRMITPGDRLGVAVSGGADSIALLRLLVEIRERLGISLVVLHFDHQLRPDSASDARFVEKLARTFQIPFIESSGDVKAAATRHKWNLEDAARRLRYQFFAKVIEQGRVTRVAVAHTMDDQAETVLARILRGAGPAGLAAIYPVAGHIIRPLLGIRRAALRKYLDDLGQSWREDATNRDTSRQRARIREHLLPLLERDFSPRAVEHLANLARLSAEEGRFWDALIEDRFAVSAHRRPSGVAIAVEALLTPLPLVSEHHALRSVTERLIRRLYQEMRGDRLQLTSSHIEQVIRLATLSSSGRRLELPGGVRVTRNFGELVFSRDKAAPPRRARSKTERGTVGYRYVVKLKDRGTTDVSVPELGTRFRLKVIDWPQRARETTLRSVLDAGRLSNPLILRSWHPGDGYCPLGRRKRRKLKEMLRSARVAAGERSLWPVLESGGQVVWAKGMVPAADCSVGDETCAGLLIEERNL